MYGEVEKCGERGHLVDTF